MPRTRPPRDGLFELLRELDAKRTITLARAREIYGPMSEATWKRVKKRLESRGCKLRWDQKTRTFHVADPLWTVGSAAGPAPGLRARLALVRASAASLGAPFTDALAPLFDRWDAELAAAETGGNGARAAVSHRPQPRTDEQFFERLRIVECALRDHRMISFVYTKSAGGKPKPRQIEPYALHDYAGRFYVWGRERVKQAPKFFALDLMRDVALEDRFEPDAGLDINEALRHSFGMFVRSAAKPQRIVVEVDAERASFVRARRWPAEAGFQDLEDGRLRIEFLVGDPREVVAWVLGFAGAARIVSPPAAADLARRAGEDIALGHAWTERAASDADVLEFEWTTET